VSEDDKQCGIDGSFHTDWTKLPPADPIGDLVRWRGSARIVVEPASVPTDAGRVARSGSPQIVTNHAVSPFRPDNLKRLKLGEFDG